MATFKTMKVFERDDMDSFTSECFGQCCYHIGRQFEFWRVGNYSENSMLNENDVNHWLLDNGAEVGDAVLILNWH